MTVCVSVCESVCACVFVSVCMRETLLLATRFGELDCGGLYCTMIAASAMNI